MLLPPTENVCLIEGDDKELKWMEVNKLMTLPIQVMLHPLKNLFNSYCHLIKQKKNE